MEQLLSKFVDEFLKKLLKGILGGIHEKDLNITEAFLGEFLKHDLKFFVQIPKATQKWIPEKFSKKFLEELLGNVLGKS